MCPIIETILEVLTTNSVGEISKERRRLGTERKPRSALPPGIDTGAGLTAFNCSRYQLQDWTSAVSRHLVNSAPKRRDVSAARRTMLRDGLRTFGLEIAGAGIRLLLLDRRLRRRRSGGLPRSSAKKHAGKTMTDGRSHGDGTSCCCHLGNHAGALRGSLVLHWGRRWVVVSGRRSSCVCASALRCGCGGGTSSGATTRLTLMETTGQCVAFACARISLTAIC